MKISYTIGSNYKKSDLGCQTTWFPGRCEESVQTNLTKQNYQYNHYVNWCFSVWNSCEKSFFNTQLQKTQQKEKYSI